MTPLFSRCSISPYPPILFLVCLLGIHISASEIPSKSTPLPPKLQPVDAQELGQILGKYRGNLVLVNVWSTWCVPCREEFPILMRLYQRYKGKGIRFIFISADFMDNYEDARRFLADQGVDFLTYIKTGNDMEFIQSLYKEWSGAIPATLLFSPDGTVLKFVEGPIKEKEMQDLLESLLNEQSIESEKHRDNPNF